MGAYDDMAALRAEIGRRLERNALDRARHVFADRIIEFAVANATVELPDLLIEREQEVMLDELRVRLAEQGIGFEDYLEATERDEAKLLEEFRPDAEKRVKTLLVLSEIADKEGRRGRRRRARRPSSPARASGTRATRAWSPTSSRRAAELHALAAAPLQDRRDTRRSLDRPTIPSSATCSICTTDEHDPRPDPSRRGRNEKGSR